MLIKSNEFPIFKMVFDDWQFELLKSRTEPQNGYLIIDINPGKFHKFFFELYVNQFEIFSTEINSVTSAYSVKLPNYTSTNNHEIYINIKHK